MFGYRFLKLFFWRIRKTKRIYLVPFMFESISQCKWAQGEEIRISEESLLYV